VTAAFQEDLDATSLAHARDWLRLHIDRGAVCPCCNQLVRTYRRKLNSEMARWLLWLTRTWEQQDKARYGSTPRFGFDRRFEEGTATGVWIDVKQSPVRGGDYAKLLYWKLVEQKPKTDDKKDTKDSGLWRPTHKGLDFVYRRVQVPSHAYVYNSRVLKFESTLIGIEDALGAKFSYAELMASPVKVRM
jgi:hypothetical protein